MQKKIIKLDSIFFYASYFIFLLYSFFGNIEIYGQKLKMLTDIAMGITLLVFVLSIKNYKKEELWKIFLLLIFSMLFYISSKNLLLIKLSLILIISKNINFDKRLKFDLLLRVIFLTIMFILYNKGISTDVIYHKGEKIVHSIGFTNPNVFGLHSFILCIEILYINRNKLSFIKETIAVLLMCFCTSYSGSRTAFFMFILALFLFVIYKHKKIMFYNSIVKKVIIYSPFIVSIIVLACYMLYINNTNIGLQINDYLSSRLMLIKFFNSNVPISLFGRDIASFVDRSCDIAIVYMYFSFGVVGCIMYILLFQKLFATLYKNNELGIIIIIFCLIIYGFSEKLWLNAHYNILISAFSYLLFNATEGEKKNE